MSVHKVWALEFTRIWWICHSDPATAGEESPQLLQSVAEEEILRFAQDDNKRLD